MSDTVKLIIEIPKAPKNDHERWVLAHGIPLDSNSEQAEVQAYFDGQAYGWEEGRKALIDDVKAEIDENLSRYEHFSSSNTANGLIIAKKIIEKYKGGNDE